MLKGKRDFALAQKLTLRTHKDRTENKKHNIDIILHETLLTSYMVHIYRNFYAEIWWFISFTIQPLLALIFIN